MISRLSSALNVSGRVARSAALESVPASLLRRLGLNTRAPRPEPGAGEQASPAGGDACASAAFPRGIQAALVVVAASVVVLRLELSQLVPLALVAAGYVLLQEVRARGRRAAARAREGDPSSALGLAARGRGACLGARHLAAAVKTELRQDSKVPVVAPRFEATGFEAQLEELLGLITPTAESDRAAQRLADCAKRTIQQIFPEVDVVGFASGDVVRGTAFGVAVPELDIVASASPHVLIQQLQARLSKGGLSMAKLDARKLQKSAIRVCTDQLVSTGGFKFRRSAFRGQEPKVTLMAPPNLGDFGKSIPIDFSVNCVTPLYNAALVAECTQIDTRARAMILLVRRWAKDRGICHAAKGHLPPYAWTLLAVYFLQVGHETSAILPPMQGYKMVNRMMIRRGGSEDDERKGLKRWEPPAVGTPAAELSVPALFRKFVHFYSKDLDWSKEVVCVRLGQRATPTTPLSMRIVVSEEKGTQSGPSIEDPFEPARNLGTSVTAAGTQRLREEFSRASDLLDRNGDVSELLEPWVPLDRDDDHEGNADDDEDVLGTPGKSDGFSGGAVQGPPASKAVPEARRRAKQGGGACQRRGVQDVPPVPGGMSK